MREQAAPYRITDLEETDRPRERLAQFGAQVLNDAELLAILLRVGVTGENAVQMGKRLLKDMNGISGLHRASFQDICQQKGLGLAKSAQIKAAIELGRRLKEREPEERSTIHTPQDAVALVSYEMSGLEQEELWVMLLDTRNRLISVEKIYRGSVNSSQVRVGELFKAAIRRNATQMIVMHNHPSGDPTPSPDDIALTRAIFEAGKLLDVDVLDHLIIGQARHISLKERGLGFS
jgi:DNA repair protein RadC